MKILISTDTYYPHVNGCSYFGQRLAFYLQKRGHEILVIAPAKNLNGGFFTHDGVKVFGIRAIPLHYNNFSVPVPFFIKKDIEKAMTDFQPDVIHVQGHFFTSKTVLKIARKMNVPAVGTNHFMPENLVHYLHLPERMEIFVMQKFWGQFRRIFEKLSAVTSPTQTAANLVYKMGFAKKVLPVSNGIDRERFGTHVDADYLRERWNLPKVTSMLYVGRLDKEKNIDLLLKAFARACKELDVHFIIGGSGVEKSNLQKLAQDLGIEKKVFFVGFVPDQDMPSLYRIADFFVIAGIAELQSIVTMEAMASGLPVIGVNAVALPELIHPQENGFLFENGDLEAMSSFMRRMLTEQDLRKSMGQKSLEIIEKHDINRVMQQFEDIYKEAMKKNEKHIDKI